MSSAHLRGRQAGGSSSSKGKPRRHRPDVGLVLIMGILLMAGLVTIYSISPVLSQELLDGGESNEFFYRQLAHVVLGVVVFVVAANTPLRWWRKALPWLAAAAVVALSLMFIPQLSITEGGATRWLDLGIASFQPAELLKLVVLIAAAAWFAGLSREEVGDYKHALVPVLLVLGVIGLFVLLHQRDLGSMLIITAVAAAIFFVSGVPWRQLGILAAAGGAAGVLSVITAPHRLERLSTFFQPEGGLAESGYHLHQALIAVGSGGLFGLGLGGSVQVYGYLPEAANDSIFAIIAETFGLVGALTVVGLFALLIGRCLMVAGRAPDTFSRLLVIGVATWIGLQALMNIMAMIGIIPLTGITLPFISYGGSSLVLVMAAMGIVTHISKYTVRSSHENRRQRGRQRGTSHPHLSRRPSPQGTR